MSSTSRTRTTAAAVLPTGAQVSIAKVRDTVINLVTTVFALVMAIFRALLSLFMEASIGVQFVIIVTIIISLVALYQDQHFLGTSEELAIGAISLVCVSFITFVFYKFMLWCETLEAEKPVVEDVEHIKEATRRVNEEGKEYNKKHGIEDPPTPAPGYSWNVEPSFGPGAYRPSL